MQTYTVGPTMVLFDHNSSFSPFNLKFHFTVSFNSIIPDTEDQALLYHNSIKRTIKFLNGLNGAYVLETDFENTSTFVTGKVKNVSIEVPTGCNKTPMLGLFLKHKVQALLFPYTLENFKMEFELFDTSDMGKVYSTTEYNESTLKDTKLEQLFEEQEQIWINDLNEQLDELEDNDEVDSYRIPWWNRLDGTVRDFLNVLPEELENADNFVINSIDLGEELPMDTIEDALDGEDNIDNNDEPDDGYFKF